MHPTLKVPTNALGLIAILSCLLAIINIGSTTAFYAIISLSTLSMYISYIFPIVFFLIRKLEGRHPAYGPFRLGQWGIPINIFALAWAIFMIIWIPFPVTLPVTKDTMNYSAPVWIACFLFAIGDWFISGNKRFQVPAQVENDDQYDQDRNNEKTSDSQ